MTITHYPGKKSQQGVSIELFSDEDILKIDHATMDVLSTFGIQVSDEEGLKIFKNAGCDVDMKTKIVKIPEWLVRESLAKAPSQFYLYGREEKNTFEQEHKGRVHFTCFGTGIQVCRYEGPGKYKTTDSDETDLANCAKLVDWAENIDYFSLPVSARNWAGKGAQDVHEMLTSLKNTTKHFHHIDPVAANVKFYWDLAVAYYGGDAKMAKEKPIFSMLVCPTSPLELSHNASQVIIQGARYGVPVNVLSMAMAGGSSSIHLAGTLVTHSAEVLSGIVLAQLVSPGAPVWYGSSTTTFDLKHGTAPVGSPELGLISASVAKLGQFYGLPVFVAGV